MRNPFTLNSDQRYQKREEGWLRQLFSNRSRHERYLLSSDLDQTLDPPPFMLMNRGDTDARLQIEFVDHSTDVYIVLKPGEIFECGRIEKINSPDSASYITAQPAAFPLSTTSPLILMSFHA